MLTSGHGSYYHRGWYYVGMKHHIIIGVSQEKSHVEMILDFPDMPGHK